VSARPDTFLLAESGGTKTDWRWVSPAGVQAHTGPGLNPSHGSAALAEALRASLGPLAEGARGAAVAFYGAGLESGQGQAALHAALSSALSPSQILLGTDLLAAARAAGRPALLALLGTGSNAGRADGHRILAQRGGHGWLIGDPASGVDLGRRLLLALLQGRLPDREADFRSHTDTAPLGYRALVYADARPALRLSALMPLVAAWQAEPPVAALIAEAFDRFIADDLLPLSDSPLPVVTVGGVAQALDGPWRAACQRAGFTDVKLLTDIADRLVAYHRMHGLTGLQP